MARLKGRLPTMQWVFASKMLNVVLTAIVFSSHLLLHRILSFAPMYVCLLTYLAASTFPSHLPPPHWSVYQALRQSSPFSRFQIARLCGNEITIFIVHAMKNKWSLKTFSSHNITCSIEHCDKMLLIYGLEMAQQQSMTWTF